ncbi:hypothetical protein DTO282F9_3185 [Paecilomyces variotii]|nr:hypothetical protein DTO282E5_3471 [Paecilomyces variotii]KAJ9384878.1 hypothetical protein DTO063F5_4576 [Paecilomyces variotii]KAJ9399837.1 hypothetical protein DTO282F9_3185 [Paecilomyces variotii]
MEVLRSPPSTSSFVPLAEHQAHTPASFYSGPPVLHYVSERCKVVILERDLLAAPAINAMRGEVLRNTTATGNENGVNGSGQAAVSQNGEEEEGKEVVIDGIDVWVTSEKFLLYRPSTSTGVTIPYPSISLHAIQRLRLPSSDPSSDQVQGLYMQIAHPSSAPTEEDEEEESISLTVVPPPVSETAVTTSAETSTVTAAERAIEDITEKPETPTQLLFAAVSACSNLHPDPTAAGEEDEDDEGGALQGSSLYQAGLIAPGSGDGGLPPPANGSSGWITAENMHEYFDEEGNWIGGGEEPNLSLGPGAGSVRTREEETASDGNEETGNGEETKWRRTD